MTSHISPWPYAAGAAAALLAEHLIAVRDRLGREHLLSRPAAYAVGTATISAAYAGWCLRAGEHRALAAYGVVVGVGGAAVVVAWAARAQLARWAEADEAIGAGLAQLRGHLHGRTTHPSADRDRDG